MLNEVVKNLLLVEVNKLLPEDNENKLISAMRYVLLAPAKRIRFLLVIASSSAFNVKIEKAIAAAVAIEFIHAYSIIHDDLPCMDNSDIRRGQPSCHRKFGEATAVLAGDALLILAFEVLSSLNCKIIKVLSQAIGMNGMVGGQILDIGGDLNRIKEIHLMKTAKLFAASCEIGSILGGATDKEREALHKYGINLGLIFQARDDIKDYEKDKTNNLMSVLSKNEIESYLGSLFKTASDSLSSLSGNTNNLYDLLNQVKKR